MAYEKKIEPISRWEVFSCGLTLQLFIIFYFVLPWLGLSEQCLEAMFETDITDFDELTTFHDCIAKHRMGILGGCTCLLLGYPIIISHIYYWQRLHETLGGFLNVGLLNSLYHASWGISASIYCTVVPALGIFVAYYDWNFWDGSDSSTTMTTTTDTITDTITSDDTNYVYLGYVMQYQMCQFLFILWDCLAIPLGLAAGLPWIMQFLILFDCAKSKHYKLSQTGRELLVGRFMNLRVGKIALGAIMISLVCICIFGGLGDSLDFAKDGFWSYHGGSQFLELTLFISWQLLSLLLMRFACKLDANKAFLNENVESMAAQDNLQMTQQPPR